MCSIKQLLASLTLTLLLYVHEVDWREGGIPGQWRAWAHRVGVQAWSRAELERRGSSQGWYWLLPSWVSACICIRILTPPTSSLQPLTLQPWLLPRLPELHLGTNWRDLLPSWGWVTSH